MVPVGRDYRGFAWNIVRSRGVHAQERSDDRILQQDESRHIIAKPDAQRRSASRATKQSQSPELEVVSFRSQ